ncbi:hypothetical protein GGI13_003315 [Coemansia sp. RSA 455]|nr:hypothetical protein GGI13_003315 [Coemansia sp. RSA 455]
MVCSIKLEFLDSSALERLAFIAIASPDIESNISAFVQRIRQIAPMMKKTTISVVSLDFNRYPFPAQPSNDLIAQLSQHAVDIDYGFYFWPVAIDQQLSGLRSLEHCSNDPTDSGRQAVQLARRNASTLQLLKIDVHGSIDITGLVQNDDGGYVQYPCLLTFKLYGLQGLDARRLPVFPGAVPFPNLRRLDIGYENPFGDDTVFRGNATTLEYLSLNTSPVTARILREYRVFTRVSHPNLQQVNIGVKSDSELTLFDTDVDHMRFILSIGATAPVRVIRDPLTGPGFQSVIPVFGEHACIQVLKLDNIRLSLWDVIALVKALPLLSDLHTSFSGIGQRPRGVAKHKLPAYVIANYAPAGKRLRCWQFPLAPADDVKHASHDDGCQQVCFFTVAMLFKIKVKPLSMKISFAAISCLAVAALAQTNPMPASDTTSPAPKVADTPVANVVTGQMPQMPQVGQMPQMPQVGQLPQMPQVSQMPSSLTQSLLARLITYFDMSRLSSVDATTPVMTAQVFDPTMNKFTHLSMNVIQSGDVWYLPVCTVDSITAAGASAAPPAPESCQYGIQMAPVPQNAMRAMLRAMRTMFRAINAAAMEPTRFWFGRPSTGMPLMP